jgi:hypothetical protein
VKDYQFEVAIFVLGIVFLHLVFFSRAFRGDTIHPERAAQFGDFVGGYFGTVFLLASVVLLFATLRRQHQDSRDQETQTRRQKFETMYFQLLSFHRSNVAEMTLEESIGRRVFVALIRELRAILAVVIDVGARVTSQPPLTWRNKLFVAYVCLYFGVGPNSSRMLHRLLSDFDSEFVRLLTEQLNNEHIREAAKKQNRLKHRPFEGHQFRLGHYYRHLYQLVMFVHEQPESVLSKTDKYQYIKTVRAQLSTYEQALLLVNSLAPLGQAWWRNDLIKSYKMVKNLPDDFFEKSEVEMDALCFEKGYFEWEDDKEFRYLPEDCRNREAVGALKNTAKIL